MGNLRDQFKKANLLSDKEARRLAHEARVERTEKGRDQLEKEQEARQQELQQQSKQQRELTREQQQAIERERKEREEEAAVEAILEHEAKKAGPGSVKWYFATPDGSLPWLEVSPLELRQLQAGMWAVVRSGPEGTHDYRLMSVEHARRVAKLRPDVVVHAPRGAM
jgi:uncharacterized protein YaiL (DUF2058 family)